MRPLDIIAATTVAVIWGLAFIAIEYALQSFTAPDLLALRFIIAALPVFFIKKPNISWSALITLGTLLFVGQFMFLFFAYDAGIPPGLASLATHTQAIFTIIIAAAVLREIPNTRQIIGIVLAFVGLGVIFQSVDATLTYLGLILTLCGAISWAFGNTVLKKLGRVDMLALMIWLSLVPPFPAFAASAMMGELGGFVYRIQDASMISILAVLYLGLIATTVAFAIWGRLLSTYPAVMVTPFALFAPCAGVIASYFIFGESLGLTRGTGMVLIFMGVSITLLSGRRYLSPKPVNKDID